MEINPQQQMPEKVENVAALGSDPKAPHDLEQNLEGNDIHCRDEVESQCFRYSRTVSYELETGRDHYLFLFGDLLVAIDNTILAVAIPEITTGFSNFGRRGWNGSAYRLAINTPQPTLGNIYKYCDVKITYLLSILIFEGKSSTIVGISTHGTLKLDQRAVRVHIPRTALSCALPQFIPRTTFYDGINDLRLPEDSA